ncbi:pilus assembly protein [Cereibacter sphaeroides]|uniref:TadE/TadG family type IV pilus assembly protein n=1 Tax=Rhodobacterales TaxID=204455 RepID=UPI000BBED670|nr:MULTISPECIES: TadE/TadG family type IV pilus assembly protein [Paracoccaceae]MCE6960555.1 pilus assembly protein [Cereibacter sphaeroides]MCE6969505.1 pilus assembly protein [Cereibacter sphaeroides]MCE6972764.1 pilus assembly protein [Cereibacter sphaeroides]
MPRPRPLRRLCALLRSFADDRSGTALSEFVIVLPILLWAWLGMYTFWDAYATMNRVQKAAFTVSDALSRSSGVVDGAYLEGIDDLMGHLIGGNRERRTRITSIGWNPTENDYRVMWSYSPDGAMTALNTGTIDQIRARLPILTDLETIVVVETNVDYSPPFALITIGSLEIGLNDRTFSELVVTRPRFVVKVCFDGIDCGAVAS